ncbi:MAG TPA: hypothetical protein VN253_00235 [Kofleriaceae bacterium]|nr:hypothetical protein [Kofleriaceae bacterium]
MQRLAVRPGHMIFAIVDQAIFEFDDRGGERGTFHGLNLHVVDDGHVLTIRDE